MIAAQQPLPTVGGPGPIDRDSAADGRDDAADERDDAAAERDDAADRRDDAADVRDTASSWRDVEAARRDAAADERDAAANRHEQVLTMQVAAGWARADAVRRAALARRAAASDRLLAYEDRQAGADERHEAGQDRNTSNADRDSGAAEREHAEADRDTAGEDRGAAAVDRRHASLDGLTGAYIRSAGLLQLERDVLRARRTGQLLTLVFLDVDHLKAVNDAGGHAAGDRLLARVADVLRARLRPYDLVIRYGGDEFICLLIGVELAEAEQRFELVNSDLAPQGSVTAGIVTAEPDETTAALIARADAALYARRGVRLPEPRTQ